MYNSTTLKGIHTKLLQSYGNTGDTATSSEFLISKALRTKLLRALEQAIQTEEGHGL